MCLSLSHTLDWRWCPCKIKPPPLFKTSVMRTLRFSQKKKKKKLQQLPVHHPYFNIYFPQLFWMDGVGTCAVYSPRLKCVVMFSWRSTGKSGKRKETDVKVSMMRALSWASEGYRDGLYFCNVAVLLRCISHRLFLSSARLLRKMARKWRGAQLKVSWWMLWSLSGSCILHLWIWVSEILHQTAYCKWKKKHKTPW